MSVSSQIKMKRKPLQKARFYRRNMFCQVDRKLRIVSSTSWTIKPENSRGLAQFIGADSARNSCAKLSWKVSHPITYPRTRI